MIPTASPTILQGSWLIQPAYAKAHAEKINQLIKDQVIDKSALKNARMTAMGKKAFAQMASPKSKQFSASASATTDRNIYCVNPYTSLERLPDNAIVMIEICGPIMKYGCWYSWGSDELNELLISLANCERVKGIILKVDSPGGEVAGTAEFCESIRLTTKIKPVIAVIQDGIAASAAYWVIAAAQEIWVTQLTCEVGSIGIYTQLWDYSGAYEMAGIKVIDIYADDAFDKNQEVIQALAGNETLIKADLKFFNDFFISSIKSFRGQRIAMQEKEPFTGKMYATAAAKKFGLIEGQKPIGGVIQRMNQLISLRA